MADPLVPDEREHTLPEWARDELRSLRTIIRRMDQDLAEIDPNATRVRLASRRALPDRGLHEQERVEFLLGAGMNVDRYVVEARLFADGHGGHTVKLHASGGSLTIHPEVTNIIRVGVEPS